MNIPITRRSVSHTINLFEAYRQCETGQPLIAVFERLGFLKCTIGEAYQLYILVCIQHHAFAKSQRDNARLAKFYGINPYELGEYQREALDANIPGLEAEDSIKQGRFNPTDYEAVEQLYLNAYDDPVLARKACAMAKERYLEEELRNAKAMR